MAPKLKLHKVPGGKPGSQDRTPRDVLPFPARSSLDRTGSAGTRSLVAGRVDQRASGGHDFRPRFGGAEADGVIVTHAELVRDIDATLDSMQKRINRLSGDTDRLKFPDLSGEDDRLPPAA